MLMPTPIDPHAQKIMNKNEIEYINIKLGLRITVMNMVKYLHNGILL
jgi:accessory gene regulator protein AgrB